MPPRSRSADPYAHSLGPAELGNQPGLAERGPGTDRLGFARSEADPTLAQMWWVLGFSRPLDTIALKAREVGTMSITTTTGNTAPVTIMVFCTTPQVSFCA